MSNLTDVDAITLALAHMAGVGLGTEATIHAVALAGGGSQLML